MIRDRDDLRHAPSPELNFSESKWFSFHDRNLELWVSCRIGLETNKSKANRWVVIAHRGQLVFHDLSVNLELPDSEWTDITVASLRVRTVKTMSAYQLQFSKNDVSFDIIWRAATPVFDYRDCKVPLPPSLAAEHYEQSGKVSGTFTQAGVPYAVAGIGHRDHSWGVRHWEGFRDWVAFMAPFGTDSFLHLEQFNERTTGLTRHGFVTVKGRNIPITDAAITTDVPQEECRFPTKFSITVNDMEGGIYRFTGNLRLTSPIHFGSCQVGESYGVYRDDNGRETVGIIEFGYTHPLPPP